MSEPTDVLARIDEGTLSHLKQTVADALKALDEGRYGDVRRILTRGTDKGLMTQTGVIAKDGA